MAVPIDPLRHPARDIPFPYFQTAMKGVFQRVSRLEPYTLIVFAKWN
jgi:hypothetical protein